MNGRLTDADRPDSCIKVSNRITAVTAAERGEEVCWSPDEHYMESDLVPLAQLFLCFHFNFSSTVLSVFVIVIAFFLYVNVVLINVYFSLLFSDLFSFSYISICS